MALSGRRDWTISIHYDSIDYKFSVNLSCCTCNAWVSWSSDFAVMHAHYQWPLAPRASEVPDMPVVSIYTAGKEMRLGLSLDRPGTLITNRSPSPQNQQIERICVNVNVNVCVTGSRLCLRFLCSC